MNLDHSLSRHTEPCRLCRHYHGRSHGGVMLICGMHPFGPVDEQCEDFERLSPKAPPTARILPYQAPPTTSVDPWESEEPVGAESPRRTLRMPDALRVLHELVSFLVMP